MLRTKVYVSDQPLFYDYSEVDLSQTKLLEISIFDEKGNVVHQENYDADGLLESTELSVYREDGKPISFEIYFGIKKELFRRTVFEYTETGLLKSEKVYVEKELVSEVLNFYGAGDQILRQTTKKEGGRSEVRVYHYHESFRDCCIREELLLNNLISEVILYEWEMVDGKPFLVEQRFERMDNPETLRITRYYNVKGTEYTVASELYNDRGDFLEETREQCDSKGRLEEWGKHTDDLPGSSPYSCQTYKYDEKDRIILSQYSSHGAIMQTSKYEYDENDHIVKGLEKSSNEAQVFFYFHEEIIPQ